MGNDGNDACALGNHVDQLVEHLWFTTPVGLPDRTVPPDASEVDVVRLFQLSKTRKDRFRLRQGEGWGSPWGPQGRGGFPEDLPPGAHRRSYLTVT